MSPITAHDLAAFLNVEFPVAAPSISTLDECVEDGYTRRRVTYTSASGDMVPAYLLVPANQNLPGAGVVVHHQHAGQRHLGKSEVCGLAGDPYQAFGPVLARRGITVLAPDSVCFEDRRPHAKGFEADEESDINFHFNVMAHGIVRGELLMTKVLLDGLSATAALSALKNVDESRIGLLGHSYGGNTVLFQTPLDVRVAFACTSGAACSYRRKLEAGIGIEFAEVIPGFIDFADIEGTLALFAPRPTLVAAASEDKYAADSEAIVNAARSAWGASSALLQHYRPDGAHALDLERFQYIVDWIVKSSGI